MDIQMISYREGEEVGDKEIFGLPDNFDIREFIRKKSYDSFRGFEDITAIKFFINGKFFDIEIIN